MLSLHFAIIIDDQIRFLSQPDFYAQFEMAIFANLLIRQIAEDRPWSLHQICFQKISDLQPSRLLVKRYLCTESSKDILFCIIGQIKHDICAATRWLDEFTNACLQEYQIGRASCRERV